MQARHKTIKASAIDWDSVQASKTLESNTAGGLFYYTIGKLLIIYGDTIMNAATKIIALPFTAFRIRGYASAFGSTVGGNLPGSVITTGGKNMSITFPSAVTFAHISAVGIIGGSL